MFDGFIYQGLTDLSSSPSSFGEHVINFPGHTHGKHFAVFIFPLLSRLFNKEPRSILVFYRWLVPTLKKDSSTAVCSLADLATKLVVPAEFSLAISTLIFFFTVT